MELAVLEAAAAWYVRLSSVPPQACDQQAWRVWLAASPEHQRAWARVEKLQRQWGALPAGIALPTLAGAQARRRAVLKLLGLLLAAGGGGWLVVAQVPYPALFAGQRTATGERRRLQLADGSQLVLNTDTAVDVGYSDRLRSLALHRGELLVQTASDPRPFIVQAPHGTVRALGTRFTVRCEPGFTGVCVLEKTVEVRPLHQPSQVLRVQAGQQAHFDREHLGALAPAPPGAGGWSHGMLTVVDWPLAAFVTELGRYRPGVVRCAPAVAELRLSGAFNIDNTDAVLDNLSQSLPVVVRRVTRYWVNVEPA